jgi:acyl-CoA thioester hydrolase
MLLGAHQPQMIGACALHEAQIALRGNSRKGRVDEIATARWDGQGLDIVGAAGTPQRAESTLRRVRALCRPRDQLLTARSFSRKVGSVFLDGEIRDGHHHMVVRVFYEDTDFSQAVYHANYLRFFERGRTNFLRLLGTDQRVLFAENDANAAFVVRSMKIDFFKPAFMDDLLDIVTTPEEVKGASITLDQECRRGDDVLVKAQVRVAFVAGGKAVRIPQPLRDVMEGTRG